MGWVLVVGAICALAYFVAPHMRSRVKDAGGGADYRPDPLAHLDTSRKTNSIVAARTVPGQMIWDYEISYREENGDVAVHRIRLISFNGEADPLLVAYSETTGAERTFRASRIEMCANLQSGRAVRDLGAYLRRGSAWR